MYGKVSLSLHHTVCEPPVLGAAGPGRWPASLPWEVPDDKSGHSL